VHHRLVRPLAQERRHGIVRAVEEEEERGLRLSVAEDEEVVGVAKGLEVGREAGCGGAARRGDNGSRLLLERQKKRGDACRRKKGGE